MTTCNIHFKNPQQPRFRLLRICFARKSDRKTKNPLPEADFLCRNVGESADYANFAEVQAAKASPQRGHGIPRLESFPTAWARNPKAGKLPHGVGAESQGWKVPPRRGHGIPKLESFPTAWAWNPGNQP